MKNRICKHDSLKRRLVGRPVWYGLALPLLAASLLLPAGCRRERVWSGVMDINRGMMLRISSDEPFCGCLEAVNVSTEPIYLRANVLLAESDFIPVERGSMILRPNETVKARFDWAGLSAEDVYHLDAWSINGKPVSIRTALRIKSYGWPFTPCDSTEGTVEPLFMNTGLLHQH
jgi:hypothetical protein